jgi:two-component system response regulator HydG
MDKETILIVDDEKSLRISLSILLKREGYQYRLAGDIPTAIEILNTEFIDLMLLDLNIKNSDGMELLKHVKGNMEVIVITAFGSVESAVEAMKKGAFEYITKPFNNDALLLAVKKALEHRQLKKEIETLRQEFKEKYYYKNIIAKSPGMRAVLASISQIAKTDVTVLIEGASGTGKELVAKAIHNESNRANGPFIALNCGAIQESLLESELFGHEKGSFTGASFSRKGLFEEADGGTLFLDEIHATQPSTQIKLLRVLQENQIKKVGSNQYKNIDVRIISASNVSLEKLVAEDKFRQDFYYRLKVILIVIPPLKDRKEDIVPLCEFFLKKFTSKMGKNISSISHDAYSLIIDYYWKGNVRELENAIESAVAMATGEKITPADLPREISRLQNEGVYRAAREKLSLEEMEKLYILNILREAGGNQKKAADILKIGRNTLWRKMNKYRIVESEDFELE